MSHTDTDQQLNDLRGRSLLTLERQNNRLREALADAQGLNEGLQQDKDDAHQLVQMILNRLPGKTFLLTQEDMIVYDPRRWYVERTPTVAGAIRYRLKEK